MRTFYFVALALGFLTMLFLFGCLIPFQTPENETNQTGDGSQACPTLWQPVCGADNKTYANDCVANASGVEIAYFGECKPAEKVCIDSDGGKNTLEKGTAEQDGTKGIDECANSSHVKEYYCANGVITFETLACPQDYVCGAGRCGVPSVPPAPKQNCTDSDNGTDKFTSGSVEYLGNTYRDECPTIYQVKEYYCQNGSVSSTNFACPTGYQCTGGRCNEAPQSCDDSDSGKDKLTKGTLTIYKGYQIMSTNIDFCYNNFKVTEFFCDDSNMDSETIDCGTNYVCEDGKCIYEECDDSDNGQNLMAYGTTSKGDVSESDSCNDNYNVREYYCSDNEILSTVSTCPSSYKCSNGKCVQEACTDSDGGVDVYTAGSVSGTGGHYSDSCVDSDNVKEYYCSGTTVSNTTLECPFSYGCSGDACIPRCFDSDNGKNYTAKGTLTFGSQTFVDACSGGALVEYYCTNNWAYSTETTCLSCCIDGTCRPC